MQGSGHFAIAANSIEGRDARWHLHPNTDARQHEKTGPLMIVRGSGVHVFDNTGKRYIEAMSGLWSAALGFSETRLADAAYRQMRELPFYHNFNHRAVAPATDLAERLEASGVELQHAIQKIAVPESQNTGQAVHDLVRHYQRLSEQAIERLLQAGRRDQFSFDVRSVPGNPGQEFRRCRCRYGHDTVRAADKAASCMKRRGTDLFDAQVVQTPNGTDDIQDAVNGTNFMKMNFI